jgi:hypothetical protein
MKMTIWMIAAAASLAVVLLLATPEKAECYGPGCKSYNAECSRFGADPCGRPEGMAGLTGTCGLSCVEVKEGYRSSYRCR